MFDGGEHGAANDDLAARIAPALGPARLYSQPFPGGSQPGEAFIEHLKTGADFSGVAIAISPDWSVTVAGSHPGGGVRLGLPPHPVSDFTLNPGDGVPGDAPMPRESAAAFEAPNRGPRQPRPCPHRREPEESKRPFRRDLVLDWQECPRLI